MVPAAAALDGELDEVWTRHGVGAVKGLDVTQIDGEDAVLVGGRGVLAVDAESLDSGRPRWAQKWPVLSDDRLRYGDNDFVLGWDTADLTGDGVTDTVVGTTPGLHAVSGRTGEILWYRDTATLTRPPAVWTIRTGDLTGDGIPDIVYALFQHETITAVSGADGSLLWEYPFAGSVTDIAIADLNGTGTDDVVAVGSTFFGNITIQAISTITGVATPLWAQTIAGNDPTAVTVGRVREHPLDLPQVVVGDFSGNVGVYDGLSGLPQASWKHDGRVNDLALVDVDGSGVDGIVIAQGSQWTASSVEAWTGAGEPVWALETDTPAQALALTDLSGDGQLGVVAGGGWSAAGGREEHDGWVVALDGGEILWERTFPTRVGQLAAGEVFGEETILVGHDVDGGVRALGPDGAERWLFRTGGEAEDLAVVEVDGAPLVVEGAKDSTVAVVDASGSLVWQRRVPGQGGPSVKSVGADVDGDGDLLITGGTYEFTSGADRPGGRVHAYDGDGDLLWNHDTNGPFGAVAVRDLAGDGVLDVVAASAARGLGGAGRVELLTADGALVWGRALPAALDVDLDLLDLTGNGVLDVVVGTKPLLGSGFVVAVDSVSGEELWRHQMQGPVFWVDASEHGVAAGSTAGQVTVLYPATGEPRWAAQPSSWSEDGSWTLDLDGDGVPDIVTAFRAEEVVALSGADGSEIWRAPLGEEERGYRVATVLGETPSVAVGTNGASPRPRGAVYLLDALTGEQRDRFGTNSYVESLTAADLTGDGRDEVLAGSGWQVHALRTGP